MHVDEIWLENFRCFQMKRLSFNSTFNLIIGDNATGKTTLLDGISVALGALFLGFPSPANPRGIREEDVAFKIFRHNDSTNKETQFPVSVQCIGKVDDKFSMWIRELTSEGGRTTRRHADDIREIGKHLAARIKQGEPAVLPVISYYGTGRLWIQLKQREVPILKPNTRFMGYLDCLNPASDVKRLFQWFRTQELSALQRRVPSQTLEAVRRAIVSCVPGARSFDYDVSRDELMIRFDEKLLPFNSLSDGFRNMVAITADIAVRCATLNPQFSESAAEQTPGVVLIDEIDLHLHPRWQRHVVNDLLRTFPKVQFFATTHSPFIIQSLRPLDGVKLINLDDPEAVDFANKSVEDITEEVQGVDVPQRSQRFQDMMAAAEEYYSILRNTDRSDEADRAWAKARLDELSMPFSDDPAYQALLKVQRIASNIDGDST